MIPRLGTSIYRLKRLSGRPVLVIGITAKTYDRQNRTASISYSRVMVRYGIVNPVVNALANMVRNTGLVNKVSAYVIIDISDLPVSFDRTNVTYIQFDGQTYLVDKAETVQQDKAMIYTLTGVAKDYVFIVEETVSQTFELSQEVTGAQV